jgi:hypothetical protein
MPFWVSLNGQPMAEEEYSFTLLIKLLLPTLAKLHKVLYGTNASLIMHLIILRRKQKKEVVLRQIFVAKK